ncbi:uncharacterized protein BXZ73DRAFT_101254 [Epithele typhae]|uniref:uncharacterized protein n=1 Tax=Epithele typhae TaxID=378194 RepID=UPI002008DBE5|nr:uncharacterized protein BXZ73DRAFT_101254 [Epithele typhae]KAH9932714.1 hypothetical protein BXZ73DRAFT_101254 [Epithele typhae]
MESDKPQRLKEWRASHQISQKGDVCLHTRPALHDFARGITNDEQYGPLVRTLELDFFLDGWPERSISRAPRTVKSDTSPQHQSQSQAQQARSGQDEIEGAEATLSPSLARTALTALHTATINCGHSTARPTLMPPSLAVQIAALGAAPSLTRLVLLRTRFASTAEAARVLWAFPRVRTIELTWVRVAPADALDACAEVENLQEAYPDRLKGLRELRITEPGSVDAILSVFADAPALLYLYIAPGHDRESIEDAEDVGFQQLRKLPALRHLHLELTAPEYDAFWAAALVRDYLRARAPRDLLTLEFSGDHAAPHVLRDAANWGPAFDDALARQTHPPRVVELLYRIVDLLDDAPRRAQVMREIAEGFPKLAAHDRCELVVDPVFEPWGSTAGKRSGKLPGPVAHGN